MIELMQNRLLVCVVTYPDMKPLIESMCVVFHYRFSRNRYTETCLTGHWLAAKAVFKAGPPIFEGGRVWRVLLKIVEFFRDRKRIICAKWDENKVQFLEADNPVEVNRLLEGDLKAGPRSPRAENYPSHSQRSFLGIH